MNKRKLEILGKIGLTIMAIMVAVALGGFILTISSCETRTTLEETSILIDATRTKSHWADGWSLTFLSGRVIYVRAENVDGEIVLGHAYRIYVNQQYEGFIREKTKFDKPWYSVSEIKFSF